MMSDEQLNETEAETTEDATETNEAVEAARASVAALEKKNAELKREKMDAQRDAKQFRSLMDKIGGDEGLDRILRLREQAESDEVYKLMADGRGKEAIDTAVKRATTAQKDAYEKRLAELEGKLKVAETRYRKQALERAMSDACDAAQVDPEFRTEVIKAHLADLVHIDEDGAVVVGTMLDDGEIDVLYGSNGPRSPEDVLDDLRKKKPVFFRNRPSGDHAPGGARTNGVKQNPFARGSENMAAQAELARSDLRLAQTLARQAGWKERDVDGLSRIK